MRPTTLSATWRPRLRSFISARVDSRSYLGLHLTLGLVVGVLAIWAFSALLDAVLDNATLVRFDVASVNWIHAHATPGGTAFFLTVTNAGSPRAMTILAIGGGIALVMMRRWVSLTTWTAAFVGSVIIERVIKLAVHRSRPPYGARYLINHSYSFPSGHAMGSFVGIGMLLYVLARFWHPPHIWRAIAMVCGVAFVALVGFSRIYLGVHYPSDVLGGWAVSAAWMAVCVSGRGIVLHRRGVLASG
ncbi:MAG TPA: phosphatase PAP2 family protein [Gemmatimonadaceae bacterium]|nr:phosphatase PAP2 family protein [Gemmatimonadaceae bacterium]